MEKDQEKDQPTSLFSLVMIMRPVHLRNRVSLKSVCLFLYQKDIWKISMCSICGILLTCQPGDCAKIGKEVGVAQSSHRSVFWMLRKFAFSNLSGILKEGDVRHH